MGLSATQVAAQEADVSEIVVTGSRIPQPNLSSVSPIQVVGSQDVVLGGRPVTADILNQLPMVSQSAGAGLSSSSNPLSGPGGVATVDLRGLGQTRTLVLVDGRRLGIGDPNTGNPNPSPDINQIPSQLIDRIEVLTGGASATYGSDAIAGVVNFVMKRNFEGIQLDGRFGVFQHNQHNETVSRLYPATVVNPKNAWDGKSRDLSLTMGANSADGNGNVTAYLTWHEQDPVTQGKRDYSACQVNVNAAGVASCAGSSNSNLFQRADIGGTAYSVLGNNFIVRGSAPTTPPALFNSNAYSFLLQQSTRYSAGFLARYEVNNHFTPYAEFGFMNDRTNVQIAPTGLFQGSGNSPNGGFLVNCNNPFLSAQQANTFCTPAQIASGDSVDLNIGRRNIEGGGRNSFYEHTNYRGVIGTRGDLVGPWKYDLYGSYYRTTLAQASENYLAISKIANGLQVVNGPNGPVCISGGSCVPFNIFKDGGVTQAALDYLDVTGTSRGTTTQEVIEANITGDLGDYGVKSPYARDGVGVSFGGQTRRDTLTYTPDVAQLSGDLSGAGGASVILDNSMSVHEVYGEARIPLAQDVAFAKELLAEGAIRYSDYSTGIKATTYKVGFQWAPIDDIKFRGAYNRAIRAPNLLDLYTPQSVTNTSDVPEDPCSGTAAAPATASLAECQRTGVTALQYGNGGSTNLIPQCPAGQCAVLTGGNPVLSPEKAKTISVGFALTPTMLSGLTASVDYYRIKLTNGISNVPLDVSLTNCLNDGSPIYCGNIKRAPNGTIFGTSVQGAGYIVGTNANLAAGTTSGIDFQATYNLPLENWGWDNIGRLSFSFYGTRVLKSTTTPLPGEDAYDCAGLFGPNCDGIVPKWRHTLRATWTSPWDVQASVAWRYIGGTTFERDTDEPTIGRGTVDKFNHTLPARTYIDLSGVWTVNDMVALRLGVNNLFDQDPPLINSTYAGTGQPNTYPTYDLLGRQMFIGFTATF
ncbi:TonB-dependent receptor domain-containing protein [Phenylobacterium immobile]|uniref:TonB-dependent receptor domain-containing protein n=1 Tax=Phenylobacterium immobile TaxID=21 RepID=UPI0011465750|nr:TonB-dependent receptor [Phenylobacterium immobile]